MARQQPAFAQRSATLVERLAVFRSMIADPETGRAELLTYAIIAFAYCDSDGTCRRAELAIAAASRQDRKTVRTAMLGLARRAGVAVTRLTAGGRITGSTYTCAPLAAGADRGIDPRPGQPTGGEIPHEPNPDRPMRAPSPPGPMGESATRFQNPDISTGPDRSAERLSNLETERLVRHVQQLADGRGWRMDNARAAVLDAIDRAGETAVRAFAASQQRGQPAWRLRDQLAQLGQARVEAPPSPSLPPPSLTQPLSDVGRTALKLMASAHPTDRVVWYRRAQATGCDAPAAAVAAWIGCIAKAFLEAEYPSVLDRLTSVAAA